MNHFIKIIYCVGLFLILHSKNTYSQVNADSVANLSNDFGKEISSIKDLVLNLKIKSEQTEKSQYDKNYQLIIRGVDMIQELHNGSLQILTARNQNIFTKKVADINNPSSDALGFQLLDVIIKSVEENIANLTTIEKPEKARLTIATASSGGENYLAQWRNRDPFDQPAGYRNLSQERPC